MIIDTKIDLPLSSRSKVRLLSFEASPMNISDILENGSDSDGDDIDIDGVRLEDILNEDDDE